MADIKLTRPAAGQNVVVPSAPDARMVLDFAADQVSIDRPQGSDSLFFRFDDGSSIELQNFYTQYNKEAIPSFEVDGQLIAGADFFNAFGPDLAPAAGPAAGPTRAGGYTDYTNSDLADGLNSLGGLDLQLAGGAATQGTLLATATATAVAGAAGTVDYGVTLTPLTPPQTTPDTPYVPVQNGPDYPSTLPYDMMHVEESGMPSGTKAGQGATATGGMTITAPDGVGSIVINGVTVWAGGVLVANEVNVPNGKLTVGYNATTGVLSYTYTLTTADQHNVAGATGSSDQVAHEILVSVTDSDGDVGQGVIRVEVGDDGPSLVVLRRSRAGPKGNRRSTTGIYPICTRLRRSVKFDCEKARSGGF